MALSTELAEKVEALYREHLTREFGNTPSFDPITVEPATDEAGEDTFLVTIVYEGVERTIDPRKAIRVLNALATPFEELGIPPVLIQDLVPKDEYPVLLDLRAELPYDDEDRERTGNTSSTRPNSLQARDPQHPREDPVSSHCKD